MSELEDSTVQQRHYSDEEIAAVNKAASEKAREFSGSQAADSKCEFWALVEVMGHRKYAGRVTEQVIAGQGFIRVDIPSSANLAPWTKMIGPSSIYAITPIGEEEARDLAAQLHEVPIEAWRRPDATPRISQRFFNDDEDPDDDFEENDDDY